MKTKKSNESKIQFVRVGVQVKLEKGENSKIRPTLRNSGRKGKKEEK